MDLEKFSDKSDEKVIHEKIYLLKFEFYDTGRKMKSTIRCIFISVITHPNFIDFRRKISFKSALKIFTPVTGHLRST